MIRKIFLGILFLFFYGNLCLFADVQLQMFGSGSYVEDPDDSTKVISITRYIEGVLYQEIGKTWAGENDSRSASLTEGFKAQAIFALSMLAHDNVANSRTGTFDNPRLPSTHQHYSRLPDSGSVHDYIVDVLSDTRTAQILTLNVNGVVQRIRAPFGAKFVVFTKYLPEFPVKHDNFFRPSEC